MPQKEYLDKYLIDKTLRHAVILTNLEQVESGTAIAIDSKLFILTAAHVGRFLEAKRAKSKIQLGSWSGTYKMKNLESACFLFPDEKVREDLLDVCVIELPKGIFTETEEKQFACLADIDLDQKGHSFCLTGIPFGFWKPDSSTSNNRTLRIEDVLLTYFARLYRGKDRPFAYSNDINFLLKENRHGPLDTKYVDHSPFTRSLPTDTLPRLSGMSGCGVWRYRVSNVSGQDSNTVEPIIRLVGIEHRAKLASYMCCTKIGFALHLIYKKYSNLSDPFGYWIRKHILELSSKWA